MYMLYACVRYFAVQELKKECFSSAFVPVNNEQCTHTHVQSVQRCAMSSSLLSFVDRWIRCSLCAKPLFFSIIIIQNLFEITKLLILSLQNNKTKQKSNGICVFEIKFFENKLKKNQKWSV